jgi:hypothetical protein
MRKWIRFSFKSVFICAGITVAVIAAVMLVDFSPATSRQNVPAAKQARSGMSGGVNRPTQVAGSPANRLIASYGKLPLSFEANQGQTDGQVKFLSRGRGYALFLTGDEAVLSLRKAQAGVAPTFRSAVVGASSAGPRPNAVRPYNSLPRPLLLPSLGMKDGRGQELETPLGRNGGPALELQSQTPDIIRMHLVGADARAAVMGADQLPGKSNYFIGNDPKKWRTNVPNYAKVRYQNVYPGVDLVYYGNEGGQLEYDFVVAPGADPSAIVLDVGAGLVPALEGHPRGVPLRIAADGDLVVKTDGGEVRFHKPVVYQPATNGGQRTTDYGQRTPVDGHYILEANNRVQFQVAPYDHSKALFIDPILSYSTYLGGADIISPGGITENGTTGYGIAVDSSGNTYVTGWTDATNFPTVNPIQATCENGEFCGAAFVTKFNAAGSALVYSTYLNGIFTNGDTSGFGIAVDSSGNAYVTGQTHTIDFPTVNPIQATCGSSPCHGNAFVAKLNAAGSALVYSTYLGGSGYYAAGGSFHGDAGSGIAVDSSGNAYVTGFTPSTDFPTVNPIQATNDSCYTGDCGTVFVSKFNAAGSALVYSTYLGGSGSVAYHEGDGGSAIAVDPSGGAYVTGYTSSTNFPTVNPIQTTGAGFVSKFNAAGSALVYSTYFSAAVSGIAVDSSGNAYVTGATSSNDFPTVNPLQPTDKSCCGTAFVSKLNAAGSALVYSTYLGGSGNVVYPVGDGGSGIAVDSSDNAYVTGWTSSTDFPTADPLQATCDACPNPNAFVTEFNAAGSALVYSTYLGGSGGNFSGDQAYGIAVDPSGGAYVTGSASSTNFPTTAGAFQTTLGAQGDGFVAKISPGVGAPLVNLSPTSLTFGPQDLGTSSAPETVVFTNTGNTLLTVPSIVASAEFGQTNTCGGSVGARGNCTISVTFTPTGILSRTGTLTISDNAANSPQTIALSGLGVMPVVLLPASLNFGNQAQNATSPPQTITLLSNQTTPQAISVTTSGNFAQSNTCGGSVPPWSRCTISVTFTPSILGVEAGALTVTDAASNIQQTASLSGTGVLPAALNPTSLNFGGQAENTTSPPQTLILTNSQSTPLAISSVTTNGDFAQTNTCGSSVPATSSCTISVTYTPSSLGVETGTLTVTDGASNSSQTASLAGRGLLQAQLSTPSVAFAAQTVGTTSPAWNVLLGNNLTTALPISITFTGADPGDFAQTNTCGASLAPKSTCTISLTFTPTATGTRTATLTVTDSANNSPQTMALSGTGD